MKPRATNTEDRASLADASSPELPETPGTSSPQAPGSSAPDKPRFLTTASGRTISLLWMQRETPTPVPLSTQQGPQFSTTSTHRHPHTRPHAQIASACTTAHLRNSQGPASTTQFACLPHDTPAPWLPSPTAPTQILAFPTLPHAACPVAARARRRTTMTAARDRHPRLAQPSSPSQTPNHHPPTSALVLYNKHHS